MRTLLLSVLALFTGAAIATAHDGHEHMHGMNGKAPDAFTATPAFAPDGTLWLARGTADRVLVSHSSDLGKTFSTPVSVTPGPVSMDWGPDSRPQILIDRQGRLVVTYALFQDEKFNGRVYVTHSDDGGKSFAPSLPITPDATSQRFQSAAIDSDGRVFAAWLDKRNRRTVPTASLAYAWSDSSDAPFGATHIAADNTCECCRLGLAFAGPGRPAILFRNVFPGSVRDHAVVTLDNATAPGKLRRVSVDDWKIEACPHQGPSLAIAADGSYHAAWFTEGSRRQGLFYARAANGEVAFGEPRALSAPDKQPSRPYLLAVGDTIHLVWKEFDGAKSVVRWQMSRDDGRSWTAARTVAKTADASDHPLLVAHGDQAFLSWLTKSEGYRLIALGAER